MSIRCCFESTYIISLEISFAVTNLSIERCIVEGSAIIISLSSLLDIKNLVSEAAKDLIKLSMLPSKVLNLVPGIIRLYLLRALVISVWML